MRNYTTKQDKGSVVFTCLYCRFRVTTLEFEGQLGNCRTQAAAAINQHAASAHHQSKPVSASGVMQRRWPR